MKVEIYSDVVCPWCYIGKRRFERALADYEDADGNGQWAVGIRCAEISGPRARLFAGVGVVAGSDPDAELAETQAKFQAMLSALVRP